jgi:hypothetical protein
MLETTSTETDAVAVFPMLSVAVKAHVMVPMLDGVAAPDQDHVLAANRVSARTFDPPMAERSTVTD